MQTDQDSTILSGIRTSLGGPHEVTEFPWGSLAWFASGGLGNDGGMTIGRCILKPGEANPRHFHPNCSEVLVVLAGTILHTGANGDDVELKEGDTVTIPRRIWHQARNIGHEEAVLFIAFSSPQRETVGE